MDFSKQAALLKVKNSINSLVKLGKNENDIIRFFINKATDIGCDEETLTSFVKECIENHGNYKLVQKVLRSKLIINQTDINKIYLLDPMSYDYDLISHNVLKDIIDKKVDISDKKYICNFEYMPYNRGPLKKTEDGYYIFNTYTPPKWCRDWFYSEEDINIPRQDKLPKIYEKFLKHLVAMDEPSFEYVLDWLATMVRDRNYCILTTIGSQGVGKGVLGNIIAKLVGDHNYFSGSDNMFKGRFNSQIAEKRAVYCDEISIKKKEEEDRLKLIVNNEIEVEKKGVDATNMLNHANFYVSSNNLNSIKLTRDDRRFSIINLTSKKLIKVFNEKQISELLLEDNIQKLGRYLFYRKVDKNKMMRNFSSKRTEEVRQSSLQDWEDYFLQELAIDFSGKTIKIDKAKQELIENVSGKFTTPGRGLFQRLESVYPEKFRVFNQRTKDKDTQKDKYIWKIQFPEIGEEIERA